MSAQALVASSVYPIIRSGSIATLDAVTTPITYDTPFPSGSIPLVFLQNAEGATWPDVPLTTQSLSNTGFVIVQSGTTTEIISVSYLAVWVPSTPPP